MMTTRIQSTGSALIAAITLWQSIQAVQPLVSLLTLILGGLSLWWVQHDLHGASWQRWFTGPAQLHVAFGQLREQLSPLQQTLRLRWQAEQQRHQAERVAFQRLVAPPTWLCNKHRRCLHKLNLRIKWSGHRLSMLNELELDIRRQEQQLNYLQQREGTISLIDWLNVYRAYFSSLLYIYYYRCYLPAGSAYSNP